MPPKKGAAAQKDYTGDVKLPTAKQLEKYSNEKLLALVYAYAGENDHLKQQLSTNMGHSTTQAVSQDETNKQLQNDENEKLQKSLNAKEKEIQLRQKVYQKKKEERISKINRLKYRVSDLERDNKRKDKIIAEKEEEIATKGKLIKEKDVELEKLKQNENTNKSLLTNINLSNENESMIKMCSNCEEENSVALFCCKECRDYLCESCHQDHLKLKLTRNHTLNHILMVASNTKN